MPIKRSLSRAQASRAAIERIYIAMRHLFLRGHYKPLGVSGEALITSLRTLSPEIYGFIKDPEKVELNGLLYVFNRLPRGIEECRHITLITREGYESSNFEPIIPAKRRRQSYRIDQEQMLIEMTRGRSDIYDILTHLTFMFNEAEKIRRNSLDSKGMPKREWKMLESLIIKEDAEEPFNQEVAYSYLSVILGQTYKETVDACQKFSSANTVNSIFHITYWLGKLSIEEHELERDREIFFSSALRAHIGHHDYGELWSNHLKLFLQKKGWLERPLHIISANLHSVKNSIYACAALDEQTDEQTFQEIITKLSLPDGSNLQQKIDRYAAQKGLYTVKDESGMNIDVQIIDPSLCDFPKLPAFIRSEKPKESSALPLILVIDYAFGEQAYEVMDELLKPFEQEQRTYPLQVKSISIMGKAGVLGGKKGDIMIPNAHVFEGTADNYPLENDFTPQDFKGNDLEVFSEGPMVTVLGTSLQNRDILRYFSQSSWGAIGLEMEGAHYQKAIQGAMKIRNNIPEDVKIRYAYYASDNPLISGQTLASGSLGVAGVKPTYFITQKILERIFFNQ